jgi:hypothetical protein
MNAARNINLDEVNVNQVVIRVVQTENERQEVFKFRYKIYVEGMNRDKHVADHNKKILTDWRDSTAVILAAYCDDKIVGTGRINFSSDGCLGEEELFGFSKFEKKFPGKLTLTSKLLVAPEFRGSRVYLDLARKFCEISLQRGAVLNFIITATDLVPLFSRLGFRKYREGREWLDYGFMNPMILDLSDVEYLQKRHSPFVEMIERYRTEDSTWIKEVTSIGRAFINALA